MDKRAYRSTLRHPRWWGQDTGRSKQERVHWQADVKEDFNYWHARRRRGEEPLSGMGRSVWKWEGTEVATFNVRGMNMAGKRQELEARMTQAGIDIVML